MDAVTSFELEAQRRRETVASDRDTKWAQMRASMDAAEETLERMAVGRSRTPELRAGAADCQPAPLARNPAG